MLLDATSMPQLHAKHILNFISSTAEYRQGGIAERKPPLIVVAIHTDIAQL
jgi:hypothetical protein